MTINERVKKIIDELFSGNKRAFSFAVGISPTVTENIVGKRKSSPSFDVTSKIVCSIDNINAEWLLTGHGDMLKFSEAKGSNQLSAVSDNEFGYGTSSPAKPFIESVYDIMPVPDSFSLLIESEKCKRISVPVGDYDFSLRGYGDSMVNTENPGKSIKDHDIVACKLWKSNTHIRWGEVYALATSEGYIIKKIVPSENKGYIRCLSFNEAQGYTPYELSLSEVFDWAIVVATVDVTIW